MKRMLAACIVIRLLLPFPGQGHALVRHGSPKALPGTQKEPSCALLRSIFVLRRTASGIQVQLMGHT